MSAVIPAPSPFMAQMGCQVARFDQGEAELSLSIQPEHTNTFGVAHGGVLMSMLDVSMALAARSAVGNGGPDDPGLLTIDMNTHFLRPGEGQVRAIAKVMHTTVSLAFCEARVVDAQDQVCAHATATFKILRSLAQSRRAAKPPSPRLSGSGSD